MALPVKKSHAQLARANASLVPVYRSVLRVGGIVLGISATASASAIVLFPDLASQLLTAAGGLGALAFGAAQVHGQLTEQLATHRRVRVIARLARRGLVDRVNSVHGRALRAWVEHVGTSKAIDPIEQSLRELVDLAAPLGGALAASAEQALQSFHVGAEHINGLFLHLPNVSDFGSKDIASKGRALAHWIRAIDRLELITPREKDEITVSAKAREYGAFTEEKLAELADHRQSG